MFPQTDADACEDTCESASSRAHANTPVENTCQYITYTHAFVCAQQACIYALARTFDYEGVHSYTRLSVQLYIGLRRAPCVSLGRQAAARASAHVQRAYLSWLLRLVRAAAVVCPKMFGQLAVVVGKNSSQM